MIQIACASCTRPVKVHETSLGKRVKCPLCGNVFEAVEDIPVLELVADAPPHLAPSAPPSPNPVEAISALEPLVLTPLEEAPTLLMPARPADRPVEGPVDTFTRPAVSRTKMWAWIGAGVACAVLLAVGVFALVQIGLSGSTLPPIEKWQVFRSQDGKFRVKMPGTPTAKNERDPASGVPTTMYEVSSRQWSFVSGYTDMPDMPGISVQERFAGSRQGLLDKLPADSKLLEEKALAWQGRPARRWVVEVPRQGKVIAWGILVHQRYYVLVAAGSLIRPDTPEITAFFESFQVDRDFVEGKPEPEKPKVVEAARPESEKPKAEAARPEPENPNAEELRRTQAALAAVQEQLNKQMEDRRQAEQEAMKARTEAHERLVNLERESRRAKQLAAIALAEEQARLRKQEQESRQAEKSAAKALEEAKAHVQKFETEATKERHRAERAEYSYRLCQADKELAAGNRLQACRLPDSCPETMRRWEWHYLRKQSDSALLSLAGGPAVFSPDGKYIVGYRNGSKPKECGPIVWDAATGQVVRTMPPPSTSKTTYVGDILDIALSPDQKYLAISAQQIYLYDFESGRLTSSINRTRFARELAFSPDSKLLAVFCADAGMRLMFIPLPPLQMEITDIFCPPTSHASRSRLKFSPDGKFLVGGGKIVDLNRKKNEALTGQVTLSSNFRRAAEVQDSTIVVYEIPTQDNVLTRKALSTCKLPSSWTNVCDVALSPDGTLLAASCRTRWEPIRVWNTATGEELAALANHSESFDRLTFSPDGKRLMAIGQDSLGRHFKVWEMPPHRTSFVGHAKSVRALVFSPDGKTLATAGEDASVKLWNLETGALRHSLPHADRVESVTFSPDGKRLYSSQKQEIKVWDTGLGKESHTIPCAGARYLATSGDGKYLAASAFSEIIVWDADTRVEVRRMRGSQAPDLVFLSEGGLKLLSRQGPRLYCAEFALDVPSGQLVERWSASGSCVTLNRSKQLLALGLSNGTISLRNLEAPQKEVHRFLGHVGRVKRLAFSPDGACLASAADDQTIKIWDIASGTEALTLCYKYAANDLAFSPDGNALVSCAGNEIRLWERHGNHVVLPASDKSLTPSAAPAPPQDSRPVPDRIQTPRLTPQPAPQPAPPLQPRSPKKGNTLLIQEKLSLKGEGSPVTSLGFSEDGKFLITGRANEVALWDLSTQSISQRLSKNRLVAISRDGRYLAVSPLDDKVNVKVDIVHGATFERWKTVHREGTSRAFSSDARCLISTRSKQLVFQGLHKDERSTQECGDRLGQVAVSSDGKLLAVVCVIQTNGVYGRYYDVQVRETISGQEMARITGLTSFLEVVFSPDAKKLAMVDSTAVRIWDRDTQKTWTLISEPNHTTFKAAFDSSSKRLVVLRHNTLALWDLETKSEIATFSGGPAMKFAVACSPDGKLVAASGHDGTVHCWSLEGLEDKLAPKK